MLCSMHPHGNAYVNASPTPQDLQTPHVPSLLPERLLGVGGRSATWLVTHRADGSSNVIWSGQSPPRTLALKIPLRTARSAPQLRSARKELEAMLPLLHPSIVRPWGLARTDQGQVGLLLQPYTAGSLAQLQRATTVLAPGECATALIPIAQALAHLHSYGAAHGDVTAANILLTPEGRPALGDLGDAVLLGMDAALGTAESDVHSLAAVAWRCLTGREPEGAERRVPLQSLVPQASHELTELLEACLSQHPTERPSAREFAAELFEAAEPQALNLLHAVDEHALTEVPTVLPGSRSPHRRVSNFRSVFAPRIWKRMWGPVRRRIPT